jgi:hypothetical protein
VESDRHSAGYDPQSRSISPNSHLSVQVYDTITDNIVTNYQLRRLSGRPADCT